MKLENKVFELKDFASEMAKLKTEKHFDFLVTIVGEDFGEEGSVCTSLLHCFISVISIAFTNGTGIGDLMAVEPFVSGNLFKFYAQMILSLSFFIFVNVIMMNIIFGVIVDTFGELRDKLEAQSKFQIN